MSSHTTFKIGGCARLVVYPESTSQICEIVKVAKAFNARLIPNGVSISKAPDALAKKDYALAIANIWTKGKSLQSLVEIAPRLKFPIVVVGDLKGASLAHNMIHAGKDLSDTELARLYTEASVATITPVDLTNWAI